MKRILYILVLGLACSLALSQSTQKQGFQEVGLDTMRTNHYGPLWGIVLMSHDTVIAKITRDSTVFFAGGARKARIDSTGLNVLADLTIDGLIKVDTIFNPLGALVINDSLTITGLLNALVNLNVAGLIKVDTIFNPLGALVVNDSLTVTGLAFVSSLKIGTNGVVVDSLKKPVTGSDFLAIYSGGVPFYAKDDSASGGTGTNPTKIAIRDTLNAASPALTLLTSQFRYENVANDFWADTVAGTHVRATNSMYIGAAGNANLADFTLSSSNQVTDSWGNLAVRTNNATSINKGGQISLGGVYSGFTPFWIYFATIAGRKENSSASDKAGYLSFATMAAGGTATEWLRIGSTGIITATGFATLDANGGTATLGAGDSVQVTVTGLTIATGTATVSYASDTGLTDPPIWCKVWAANTLSIYGTSGLSASWAVIKK